MAPNDGDDANTVRTVVTTEVKDGFFDDPFFSDWWKDFDAPAQKTYDVAFQRQISGRQWEKMQGIDLY